MSRLIYLFLSLAALASTMAGAAVEESWAKIRRGMTEHEVTAAVGVPLLAKAARGYRYWLYDCGGAVMFNGGVVVFWSLPRDYVPPPATVQTTPPQPRNTGPRLHELATKEAHLKSMNELARQKPLRTSDAKNPLPTQSMPFVPLGGSPR
jgi:hypothetical protein